jgi:P27 family predicted phage terminase small subunit
MGKRGPKPTPTNNLKLRGSWRADLREGEPVAPNGAPRCPSKLDAVGKEEWRRIVPLLQGMGILSLVDKAELAQYCQAWSDFWTATEKVREMGETFTTPQGYIAKNPWVTIKHEASLRLHKFCAEFGFSPSSRSQIRTSAPEKKADGKARFFSAAQ